ncbi:MBL fold metallo-hydrolase [Aquimarina algicola]|uniref:MBL fold metallo-hydrolase n=1 Tax=Aquimarina algicola TaxID=2589995 RepID=A0A504JE42_9FLAO|nr:MBL fold metallo-hydrolase [Aquimarina algicola]TPN85978.1 MBL fold metallo-hydrolase [Aquimarina algicola]
MNINVTHIDTACCLIEIEGFKILTDPVLDNAGGIYHHGYGAISKKYSNPILDNTSLEAIDLILLSHPQHKDNFDTKGKEFAKSVPLILSTHKTEKEFSNAKGMKPWESYELKNKNDSSILKITATPAQHHPNWLPKFISGEVIGFYIEVSTSKDTVFISGDTVFFKGIFEISEKLKPITYALIHVGSAEFRYLTGFGKFTMDAKGFVKTVSTIDPKIAIPIHNVGWSHFKENDEGVKKELSKVEEELRQKVVFLERGKRTDLTI